MNDIIDFVEAKFVLNEITLMKFLSHENILDLKDVIYFPPKKNPKKNLIVGEIYLVNSFMECDLAQIIRHKAHLTSDHVQYIIYKLLKALFYMHSAGVIHKEIKPSNILINENTEIKLWFFKVVLILTLINS